MRKSYSMTCCCSIAAQDMPQLNRAARADTVLALAWTPHPLEEWMEQLRGAAVTAAEAFRRERPGADLPTVVVTIVDNSPFSLNTTECAWKETVNCENHVVLITAMSRVGPTSSLGQA